MVAGHLREKKGYFYAVLTYPAHHGNRKPRWNEPGIEDNGTQKRAEAY